MKTRENLVRKIYLQNITKFDSKADAAAYAAKKADEILAREKKRQKRKPEVETRIIFGESEDTPIIINNRKFHPLLLEITTRIKNERRESMATGFIMTTEECLYEAIDSPEWKNFTNSEAYTQWLEKYKDFKK